jgi:hypothetical protein
MQLSTDIFVISTFQSFQIQGSTNEDYFEIPVDDEGTSFTPTSVPPNGGQKSFYVTLKSPGLMSADSLGQAVK